MMKLHDPILDEICPKGNSKEDKFKSEVILDFWICLVSRETSLLGRREVLTGKAKFGILGDGKEVPQVAMARAFKKGDHRSGYYRDQTFIMALGLCSIEEYFAQLYADSEHDPFSAGRQMNNHFATPYVSPDGTWVDQKNQYNTSSDISSTAGQMGRALGLALASKKYREIRDIGDNKFSDHGNEVCFCTIGDASTSEGPFWETMNAAAVIQVPLITAVWDDGYGISVPIEYQTVKSSISEALKGFKSSTKSKGLEIVTVKGWDYPALCATFESVTKKVRKNHSPALIHVQELTQPQGHSTSGSHERYKSKERLEWEKKHDCLDHMGQWMIRTGIIDQASKKILEERAKAYVKSARNTAWSNYAKKPQRLKDQLSPIYDVITSKSERVMYLRSELKRMIDPSYSEILQNARKLKIALYTEGSESAPLNELIKNNIQLGNQTYEHNLYSSTPQAAINIPGVPPVYSDNTETLNGYQILNRYFDKVFENRNDVVAFGEDLGYIGGVNQGFAELQAKYGEEKIFDTGIREWTIIGQAIGLSMRGLKPIAEIQYLDYLIYAIAPLSDDLATLRYRSNGLQQAPTIIRTRGHRLEGIWHSGSPLAMMISALRGIYIITPRNMVQAIGFYQTMMQSNDPAIVVECLNGYRLKEKLPDNLGEYCLPLGVPEVLTEGEDITLVTYGSCVRIASEAIKLAADYGISVELIDVQTLLPFDLEHKIVESIKKTNKVLFVDEDVPGGTTAYMMQKVIEEQEAFKYLDASPITLSAKAHRPPYGSDGDYFSKPNPESIFDAIHTLYFD